MIRILYYLRSSPLSIHEDRPVSAEDAESWVREMNEANPLYHYYTAE